MSNQNASHKQSAPLMTELRRYKSKYYLNMLFKGILVTAALLLTTYIVINAAEYFGKFNTSVRAGLFFTFLAAAGITLVAWVLWPISKLLNLNKQISDEEAALQIGKYFPDVDDKLLNTIQLSNSAAAQDNALLKASIEQRTKQLGIVKFTDAVRFSENRRYLRYVVPPLLVLLAILVLAPTFFSESSARIINYNNEYVAPAPFSFHLANKNLKAFKNEDFTVDLDLKGRTMPEDVYLVSGGRRYKMEKRGKNTFGKFAYTFKKIQKATDFKFESAGFTSLNHSITLMERPTLLSFSAQLNYPAYLNKASENWDNIGNLVVPEGTQIQWNFKTNNSKELALFFNEGKEVVKAEKINPKRFKYNRSARRSETYQVKLKNEFSGNKEDINYYINVIPDQYPKINIKESKDTAMYSYLSVGGSISDDYGLSQLKLFYRVTRDGKPGTLKSVNLQLNAGQSIQNYYYEMDLRPMNLQPGDNLEYFAQVWDNDGVNGAKSAKTTSLTFKIPTERELKEEIDKSANKTSNQIDKTLQKARKLKESMENVKNRFRNKRYMDYQDKKQVKELLEKRKDLIKEIKKIQEENNTTNQKQKRFNQTSPEVQQKMNQLKKLMDELLDEETKKLYDELQKLLEQTRRNDRIQNMLDKIQKKEDNLDKELERALEMFKQLQFEQKLDQTTKDLEKLAEKQDKLAEETDKNNKDKGNKDDKNKGNKDDKNKGNKDDKNKGNKDDQNKDKNKGNKDDQNKDKNKGNKDDKNKGNQSQKNKDLEKKQKDLTKKFNDIKKQLEELKKMDQKLEFPNEMKDFKQEQQDVSKEQQNSQQQLQKNQNKKAGKSQKKAAKKMKKMAQQMQQMQQNMQMQQMQENLDDLRAILENLVTLSFDQEKLMKDFRSVSLSDPRFVKLGQKQLKLRDDAKVIEDSLTALAKRVFQIKSFVTREVGKMKSYMDESTDMIKRRRLSIATGKQQFAMTSMNNLALLLNDVMKNMQNSMASAMSKPQKGNKGKPKPNLSQMQQQLNQKIQQLKKSGKQGRKLSEELAKLAAEQERIRRALKEMQKRMGKDGKNGKDLRELQKKMEEVEKNLVFKNLERVTKLRQKDILTRLLESEKALREQGQDKERKSKAAKDNKTRRVPPALNQYFKNKEKQIELLKTIPPALSPYYKKEVDEYFEKIDN